MLFFVVVIADCCHRLFAAFHELIFSASLTFKPMVHYSICFALFLKFFKHLIWFCKIFVGMFVKYDIVCSNLCFMGLKVMSQFRGLNLLIVLNKPNDDESSCFVSLLLSQLNA
jgi:hypothetical protein